MTKHRPSLCASMSVCMVICDKCHEDENGDDTDCDCESQSVDLEVEGDYTPGSPAHLCGAPEDCDPGEDPEAEICSVWLMDGARRVRELSSSEYNEDACREALIEAARSEARDACESQAEDMADSRYDSRYDDDCYSRSDDDCYSRSDY